MAQVGGILGGGQGAGSGVAPSGFNNEDEEDETPNVSPEEQAQYDAFVRNAMELIYAEGEEGADVHPEILRRLSTGNKPQEVVAQTTVWLVSILEKNAEQAGSPVEDDVLFHAGREVLEQLIEVMEAAKLHDFKEAEIQGAWYNALDIYRETMSDVDGQGGGRFNPEQAASEFEALNEADKEGRADEVLPGFSQMAERAIVRAQQDQNDPDAEDEAA